jgi:hypothetical protein
MKLRNKKTGEIVEPCGINLINGRAFVRFDDEKGTFKFEARSLADLNEEWEDYEEPKGFWSISADATIEHYDRLNENDRCKEIGNYFDTREQAEQTVEKLKAWKQLKDKGFRFTLTPLVGSLDVTPGKFQIVINADMPEKWFCCDAVQKDLDDCFGGEE